MPKRKVRRTSPKPVPWADRFKVASGAMACVYYALRIWEWLQVHAFF